MRFPEHDREPDQPVQRVLLNVSVVIAVGKHPVPFRTRKLSPPAPMVLHRGRCGRVGHRRTETYTGKRRRTHPHKTGCVSFSSSLFSCPNTTRRAHFCALNLRWPPAGAGRSETADWIGQASPRRTPYSESACGSSARRTDSSATIGASTRQRTSPAPTFCSRRPDRAVSVASTTEHLARIERRRAVELL